MARGCVGVIVEMGVVAVRCQPDKTPVAARCSSDVNRSDYDGGGVEVGPHHVAPVSVIEGIGGLAVAVAGGCSVGIPVAVTDVGKARTAPREEGEESLLFQGGFLEG